MSTKEKLLALDLSRPAEELVPEIEAMMQEHASILEVATSRLSRIRRRLPKLEAPGNNTAFFIADALLKACNRHDVDSVRIRAVGVDSVEVRWPGKRYSWDVSSCPRRWPQVRVKAFWWERTTPEKETLSSQYLYMAHSVVEHLRQHGPEDLPEDGYPDEDE